jgi:hypothetical protein
MGNVETMRKMLLAVTTLWASGCVPSHVQRTVTDQGRQAPFGIVIADDSFRYIIDPRTESCLLKEYGDQGNIAMVHVSCAKLKKNVPEAAAFITWEPSDAAPAAPTSPAQ